MGDTAGYLSLGPLAQCVVHALKGLTCRARVTPASSPSASSAQRSRRLRSTRAAVPVLLAHANVTESINIFSMGPKLRYPMVPYAVIRRNWVNGFPRGRNASISLARHCNCWVEQLDNSGIKMSCI